MNGHVADGGLRAIEGDASNEEHEAHHDDHDDVEPSRSRYMCSIHANMTSPIDAAHREGHVHAALAVAARDSSSHEPSEHHPVHQRTST
jgi:hypothetical protein